MIESSLAQPRSRFALCRVEPDGSKELVSRHPTFEEAYSTGTNTVTVLDSENAYSLFFEGRCLARFGHARLMPKRTVTFSVDLPENNTHLALAEIDSIRVLDNGEAVPMQAADCIRSGDPDVPDTYLFSIA